MRKFWADWAKEQARTGWASRQSLGQFSDARYWNQLVSSAVPLSDGQQPAESAPHARSAVALATPNELARGAASERAFLDLKSADVPAAAVLFAKSLPEKSFKVDRKNLDFFDPSADVQAELAALAGEAVPPLVAPVGGAPPGIGLAALSGVAAEVPVPVPVPVPVHVVVAEQVKPPHTQ